MTDVNKALSLMQKQLKAPKGQYNKFGKYKYRSCEDIVEAVKEVLPEGGTLNLSDSIELIGDRHYVKACAKFALGEAAIESYGFARESLNKKGMDESQITGTASSYARKYALNGLFAIDDTKDADTDEAKQQADNTPKQQADNSPKQPYKPAPEKKPTDDKQAMQEWSKVSVGKLRDFETIDELSAFTVAKENTKFIDKFSDKQKAWYNNLYNITVTRIQNKEMEFKIS